MNPGAPGHEFSEQNGLLIDTNLLVLYIVGSVNINRVESFKRTRKYSRSSYKLLLRVINRFKPVYTLAHVMAEVSNLTDLAEPELQRARLLLKEILSLVQEPSMPSAHAAENQDFQRLGLVDAAIFHSGPRIQMFGADG